MRRFTSFLPFTVLLGLLGACGSGSPGPAPQPNRPPIPAIASPVPGATYRVGDVVVFQGSATDPDEGVIAASRLLWWANLHHDEHTHPLQLETAGGSGTVILPDVGETSDNVFYRFHLRAVDSLGLSAEATRDLLPRKAAITLQTAPTGLQLTLDGQPRTAPHAFVGVVGLQRELGAPSPQILGGRRYIHAGWSDGGARVHVVATPDTATTYTATFTDVGPANSPPLVLLSAPATGTTGVALVISANASDPDGSVALVEFFADGALLAVDSAAPFAYNWTPLAAGTFSLSARATDDLGAQTTSALVAVTIAPPSNTPPIVALSGPATALVGDVVTLAATASDPDGSIVQVVFLIGAMQLGTDAVPPYTQTWTPTAAGSYIFTARATDNGGAETTSAAITIMVSDPANLPPAVTLLAPGAALVGDVVTLSAIASDPDGSIASVAFLEGASTLGTDTIQPFTQSWIPAAPGAYSLRARATDNRGAETLSDPVAVVVTNPAPDATPPNCALTAPSNFAPALSGAITLTATATDDVGVAGVQFQVDGEDLGAEDPVAPYAASISAATAYSTGQHVFRARARDAAGNRSPWSQAIVNISGGSPVPQGFVRTENWITGLASATAMAFAPDGRLFVCQQGGALRVVRNGALLATPFVTVATTATGERGLLGVAFHPAFPATPFVYVYYTAATPAPHNRISRFTAAGDVASGAETVLVDLPNLSGATNHNGGALHFGPDGKLFAAVGENASPSLAQSFASPFGKILRFNEDGSIPADNPFIGTTTGINQAIWAYGLRNPFTFGFQPGTGRMHINDVGQSTWEEVNLGAAGANYGWPMTEGPTAQAGLSTPLFAYGHPSQPPGQPGSTGTFLQGVSVLGAAFYNPATLTFPPAMHGQYFFADYTGNWLARIDQPNAAVYHFARTSHNLVDIAVGPDGAIYALGRSQITRVQRP